jgi:hypothetical protein
MMTNITELYNRMMETAKDDKEMVTKITKVIPKVVSAYYAFVEAIVEAYTVRTNPSDLNSNAITYERAKNAAKDMFLKNVKTAVEEVIESSKEKVVVSSAMVLAKPYINAYLDLEIDTITSIIYKIEAESSAEGSEYISYVAKRTANIINDMIEGATNLKVATAEDRFVKAVCDDYTKDLELVEDMINDAKDEYESLSEKLRSEPAGNKEQNPNIEPIKDQLKMTKKYLDSLQEKRDDIMANRHEFLKNHGKIKE